MRLHPCRSRKWKRLPILLVSWLLLLLLLLLATGVPINDTMNIAVWDMEGKTGRQHQPCGDEGEEEAAVCHIPLAVRQTWRERKFLIVFGIPSLDAPEHKARRDLQRGSWMRFRGVATLSTNFTGEMLVLFFLGRHFAHSDAYSREALEESAESCDTLTPPTVTDLRPTSRKHIGGGGYWGLAAEVGASRKSFMWYRAALHLFPDASYIAKGDDDMFLRVPQFIADLNTLPRGRVYWGRMLRWMAKSGDRRTLFYFAGGMCITMSRDVAAHITSYTPLQQLMERQIVTLSQGELLQFISHNANHEDVMLGRVLYDTRYPRVIFVYEARCRFHDFHIGSNLGPITKKSVVVHHLRPHEYAKLAHRFMSEDHVPKPILFERRPGPVGIVGEALYSYRC